MGDRLSDGWTVHRAWKIAEASAKFCMAATVALVFRCQGRSGSPFLSIHNMARRHPSGSVGPTTSQNSTTGNFACTRSSAASISSSRTLDPIEVRCDPEPVYGLMHRQGGS